MPLVDILTDKRIKKLAARAMIVEGIVNGDITIEDIDEAAHALRENKVATILEAIEEITNKGIASLDASYLDFAKRYIGSENNSCKREASRIVGNMCARYPHEVEDCIPSLLANAGDDGTVVRWGSAYALSRIIVLEAYRNTGLYATLARICEGESESGVRNQYLRALKRARR